MTTKKQKPLTILGAPLRKFRNGWIAKTNLGVVRIGISASSHTSGWSFIQWRDSSEASDLVRLECFGSRLLELLVAETDAQLRAMHKACQVKL